MGAFTCVLETASACSSAGGSNLGSGTCDPNPCGGTTTTTAPSTTTTTGPPTTTTTGPPTTTTTGPPTTTSSTTTPTTSTTSTTTIAFTKLTFTNTPGTTNCGSAGLTSPPSAPFSGEIDSDMACSAKISDLGLGCLYIGGGGATSVPPGATPDGATNIFDIQSGSPNNAAILLASSGTSNLDCTLGAGPGMHCIGSTNFGAVCASDADCGGSAGACALDATCFFAAPLPIVNAGLSTCVVNVIQTDAGGMADLTAGTSSVSIPLSSRVYLTGNSSQPCPRCVSGTCTYGENAGGACSAGNNTLLTSVDCPPPRGGFLAPLAVTLSPLTTGTASMTNASGSFCPSQPNPGAFGQATAQCIQEAGVPAGDLTDGLPHPSNLASVFCIPQVGNPAIDLAADLPGPGAFSITGNAQAQ
jgi:hypothetical protein